MTKFEIVLKDTTEKKAYFKVIKGFECGLVLNVKLEALLECQMEKIRRCFELRLETKKFAIRLPQRWKKLKFVFKENSCQCPHKQVICFPYYCKSEFDQKDFWVRKTFTDLSVIANDTSGLDHTPVAPNEKRVFGHQLGPCRAARAMAIVHIAIFEAYNCYKQKYESYVGMPKGKHGSRCLSMVEATFQSLKALFPSHEERLKESFKTMKNELKHGIEKKKVRQAKEIGAKAAELILKNRENDGSDHKEPIFGKEYKPTGFAGEWEPDPISGAKVALGAFWSNVKPFFMTSAHQFRCREFPKMDSSNFSLQFNDVKSWGGDNINTETLCQPDQKEIGIFWAYDGRPSLCAPPKLYNQVARQILTQENISVDEYLRNITLLNVIMADAAIGCWESKYYYRIGRPVTVIRKASSLNNPNIIEDKNWHPLGAPASNAKGPNFTPPFPAYPSGHTTFGGSCFELLRLVLGRDDVPFIFTSDEFNGVTTDNEGKPRPLKPRHYGKLSQAEQENGQSRIYLGIHWQDDKTEGDKQGQAITRYAWDRLFRLRN